MRRHVLTLVAVFLALAVGVVLGSTSVATSIRDAVVDREETTAARLEAAQDDLAAERRAVDRLDGLAADLTPAVLDGRLDGRPVLIVVAPGAAEEDVTAAG
ncbi:copper transporter, partial [Dietzia sp. HMSC21D01]